MREPGIAMVIDNERELAGILIFLLSRLSLINLSLLAARVKPCGRDGDPRVAGFHPLEQRRFFPAQQHSGSLSSLPNPGPKDAKDKVTDEYR